MPLFDPQLLLDLLQRYTLRLRNHRFHPNQLENHHAGKERENVSGREGRDHPREERCEQRGEDLFLHLRSALKGPSRKYMEALKDLRYALAMLREFGFDQLSDAQLEDLLVDKLK